MTITRYFNAGFSCKLRQVPEGRPKCRHRFSHPCGTCPTTNVFPALKRRAIFRKSLWDCVVFPVVLILFFAAGATAQMTNTSSAAEIQGHKLAQQLCNARPAENSTNTGVLKIRDEKGNAIEILTTLEIVIMETNWQSTYYVHKINTNDSHAAWTALVVIHSENNPNRYQFHKNFLEAEKFGPIATNLAGTQTMIPFAGSDFWVADLGLEFFHWPAQKILPKPTSLARGRDYTLLESTNPNPSANDYSRVLSWIDKETGGILQAEAYDFNGKLLKEFEPKSFKKVNGQWELQEMKIRNVQTGSRTRLEFDLKK